MAKTPSLNFIQKYNNISLQFNSSDLYSVIQVAPTTNGTNLTPGVRTFTAFGGGIVPNNIGAATWTMNAVGLAGQASVTGPVTPISMGYYTPGNAPTSPNSSTVDAGSTNATFNLTVGILKPLYMASANDAVIKAINVSSTDTVARVMSIWEQDSTSNVMNQIASILVPALSGTRSGTTPTVDGIPGLLVPTLPYDTNGKRVFPVKAGTDILISFPGVSASNSISVHAIVEEY